MGRFDDTWIRNSPAFEYLNQARLLDARIDSGFSRIMQLRALAERRTAVYGREKVSSSPPMDGRMDIVARIVDMEHELDAQIDQMVSLKREIDERINSLPDERFRVVLTLRYLQGLCFEEIAEKMHYTARNVYNLHRAALNAFEQRYLH